MRRILSESLNAGKTDTRGHEFRHFVVGSRPLRRDIWDMDDLSIGLRKLWAEMRED